MLAVSVAELMPPLGTDTVATTSRSRNTPVLPGPGIHRCDRGRRAAGRQRGGVGFVGVGRLAGGVGGPHAVHVLRVGRQAGVAEGACCRRRAWRSSANEPPEASRRSTWYSVSLLALSDQNRLICVDETTLATRLVGRVGRIDDDRVEREVEAVDVRAVGAGQREPHQCCRRR